MDPDTNHQPKLVGTGQVEAVRVVHEEAGEAYVAPDLVRYYKARGWSPVEEQEPEQPEPSRAKRATKEQ